MSHAYFDRCVFTESDEWYGVGSPGLTVGVTTKLTLNPSFNLSIDLAPSARWERSPGLFHDFDGQTSLAEGGLRTGRLRRDRV